MDAPLDHADVVGLGERGELDVGAEQLEGAPVVDEGSLLRVVEHCGKKIEVRSIFSSMNLEQMFTWRETYSSYESWHEFHLFDESPLLTHEDLLAQKHVAVEFSVLPICKFQHSTTIKN